MRLAVIADMHGNLPALEAVMAGLRVNRVVTLGDRGSGPLWPRETLAVLRQQERPTVLGNHDRIDGTAADRSQPEASDRYAFDTDRSAALRAGENGRLEWALALGTGFALPAGGAA